MTAIMDETKPQQQDDLARAPSSSEEGDGNVNGNVNVINASGHTQELRRHFTLLSLAGIGLTVGSVWPAIGGSILIAIFNGGPPGVLYEFIAVSVFYWCVTLSVAELASAMPSSAGVYHWASVTPGGGEDGWGRPVGFVAGWWNYLAWVLGAASMTSIFANTVVQMYAVTHDDGSFQVQSWHVFVTCIITTTLSCAAVCFANGAMPSLNRFGIFAVISFFIITVVVVTVMPGLEGHAGHATSSFVWTDWAADIGYPDGFVFVAGMLNGAYSVGAVDAVTHLAEEIPNPSRNVPLALLCQVCIGFVTGLAYLIAVLYAISDLDALASSPFSPLAEIYRQATGSGAGAAGLLALIMVCVGLCVVGLHLTCGRTLWALARDGAAPFPGVLSRLSPGSRSPVPATLVSAFLIIALGAIQVGSTTAFNAFVSAYILLSTSSYLACILPHLLTRRRSIPRVDPTTGAPVYFRMPDRVGYIVNGVACAYMLVWGVIYSFPYALPTDAVSMNYASLIWGGLTMLVAGVWVAGARKGYRGPLGALEGAGLVG